MNLRVVIKVMLKNERFTLKLGRFYCDNNILQNNEVLDLLNDYADENKKLKSLNQELRNELEFDAKQYKVFIEVIDEADDLIKSHLSKHYQRKWKNFCKSKEIEL